MQMLHPFEGSVQEYAQQLGETDRYRPAGCPLCGAKKPLIAHGFYGRSVVAEGFDGWIRVRRYLCRLCQRTVFAAARVRLALCALCDQRHRPLSEGAVAGVSDARASGSASGPGADALPAGPGVGGSLSPSGPVAFGEPGGPDASGRCSRAGFPGAADAPDSGLDPFPSFSVFSTSGAPAGLAPFSGSGRAISPGCGRRVAAGLPPT